MPTYETEESFREGVEKRLGVRIPDKKWSRCWTYLNDEENIWPSYDKEDVSKALLWLKRHGISKPKKSDRKNNAAYVRADLAPESEIVEKIIKEVRTYLFGSPEPPFSDLDTMREWIISEAALQPPAEGHAPRYGYKLPKGMSVFSQEFKEIYENKPGIYGLEYATLAIPEKAGFTSHEIVSDGTRLRRLWLAVGSIARRLDCQEAQATALILTGMKPLISPITVETPETISKDSPSRAKIVLTIREPVPEERVLKVYRQLRKQLWGHIHNHQPVSDKDCMLVEFIKPNLIPDRPQWERKRIEWNHLHPEWNFDDWRHLRTAYQRAKEKIYPPIIFGPVTIEN